MQVTCSTCRHLIDVFEDLEPEQIDYIKKSAISDLLIRCPICDEVVVVKRSDLNKVKNTSLLKAAEGALKVLHMDSMMEEDFSPEIKALTEAIEAWKQFPDQEDKS